MFCKYAVNLQKNPHAGCSPVNSLHIFRTSFPKNTFGWLLLILIRDLFFSWNGNDFFFDIWKPSTMLVVAFILMCLAKSFSRNAFLQLLIQRLVPLLKQIINKCLITLSFVQWNILYEQFIPLIMTLIFLLYLILHEKHLALHFFPPYLLLYSSFLHALLS